MYDINDFRLSYFFPSRMLVRQVATFAQWENEIAIDNFLKKLILKIMNRKADSGVIEHMKKST